MITREKKDGIISSVKDGLENAKAVFLTNLIGVSANEAVAVRKKIRDCGGKVIVTRNTLFKRGAEGSYASNLVAELKGPHALAFAFEEAPAVAKVLFEARKENEVIELKGGYLGDKALTAADIEALAKLPSRDEMLGTLLATFNAPISALARVLYAVQEKKAEGSEASPVEAKSKEATTEEVAE